MLYSVAINIGGIGLESSDEVLEAVRLLYEAISSGDVDSIGRSISKRDGVVVIGTDPNEWWTDYAKIISVFQAQIQEQGGGIPIVAGDLKAYSEGDTGWFDDRSMFRLTDGDFPFRHTGVLHKENGEWKFVQLHASIGVSNEEEFGKELTT
jgi:hypothetical protein